MIAFVLILCTLYSHVEWSIDFHGETIFSVPNLSEYKQLLYLFVYCDVHFGLMAFEYFTLFHNGFKPYVDHIYRHFPCHDVSRQKAIDHCWVLSRVDTWHSNARAAPSPQVFNFLLVLRWVKFSVKSVVYFLAAGRLEPKLSGLGTSRVE